MCIWIKWKKSKSIYLQGRQSCVSSAYPACLACHLGPVGDCSSVHVQGNTSMCWKSDLRWIATRVWSTDLKTQSNHRASWELWQSDAISCYVLEPSRDFDEILANHKSGKTLPLSTKQITTERKDRLISNKDETGCNGADRWWHVIISHSFCEYNQFLLLCLHQNT